MKTIGNIIYVIAGLWLLFSLVSCNDNDTFGSGSLTFEADTLSLDTCFSTIPTPHKTLMVYNNSGDGIRISRVYLEKMNQTGLVPILAATLDSKLVRWNCVKVTP